MVTTRRPLTINKLVIVRALGLEGWDEYTILIVDILNKLKDSFKFCEPLIYLDDVT